MARRWTMCAALLALAAGCQRNGNVDPVVAEMARTIRMPQASANLTLKASRGEGRTLILELEMPDDDIAALVGARDVATSFAHGICARPSGMNFFQEGRTLRVDLSTPRRPATSATVGRCPPGPVGQGVNVATYAQMYQRMVGRDLGDGSTIAAVRVEGQTLVLVMNGRAGWRTGTSAAAFTQEFLGGFCEPGTGNSFFGGGRALRIDTTEAGGNLLQGQPVTACPGGSAARP